MTLFTSGLAVDDLEADPSGLPEELACERFELRCSILQTIGISQEKDFSTYEFLGNMGTVSLPVTAAIAKERDNLLPGDIVGFLGIGSGLNCLMLGIQW